jgi:pyruvate dehydrogenase E2 component (dihydrolipoamide acetyltransferase)
MTEITMPRLSDSMEQGTIASWLKSDGDRVDAGDELVEIETDKATADIPARDGAAASQFLSRIRDLLEQPLQLAF